MSCILIQFGNWLAFNKKVKHCRSKYQSKDAISQMLHDIDVNYGKLRTRNEIALFNNKWFVLSFIELHYRMQSSMRGRSISLN